MKAIDSAKLLFLSLFLISTSSMADDLPSSTTTTTTTAPSTTTGAMTSPSSITSTSTTVTQPAAQDPGMAMVDNKTTSNAQAVIAADNSLTGTNITVVTSNGIVTLSGTVNNQTQADTAAKLVRGLAGVKDVKSTISVSSTTPSPTSTTTSGY